MDDFGSSSSDYGSSSSFGGSDSSSQESTPSSSRISSEPHFSPDFNPAEDPALIRIRRAEEASKTGRKPNPPKMSFSHPPPFRSGGRVEVEHDDGYTGMDYETGETWRSKRSRTALEQMGIEQHISYLKEAKEKADDRSRMHKHLISGFDTPKSVEAPKRGRLLPLWRHFTYAAPEGMILNPDRERTRDHLVGNVHKILWRMLTAAFGGFFLSMLAKLVLNIFADPSTMIEDALFPISAAFIFWRGLSSDWHKEARLPGSETARYIPVPEVEKQPATRNVVSGHLEHIEALALPNLDIEMENAARSLAKSIKTWSKVHDDPVGSQAKREMHLIRTVADAAREMKEKPGLRNSMEARGELIDVMKSADAHLQEQTKEAGAAEATNYKSGLRALKSQMGLGKRKG